MRVVFITESRTPNPYKKWPCTKIYLHTYLIINLKNVDIDYILYYVYYKLLLENLNMWFLSYNTVGAKRG